MIKLSYTTMATPELSGIEAIKLAREFGYNGVDLRVSPKQGELTVDSTIEEINELRHVFDAEGIVPSSLFCYNSTGNQEPDSWIKMKESILQNIDIANKLGTTAIRISVGNINSLNDQSEHIKRATNVISDVFNEDKSDIKLYLQNHNMYYPASSAIELVKSVNNHRFKLAFSPEHCVISGENLENVFPYIKDVTGQLFVADVIKENDKFVDILPGKGVVPIEKTFSTLGGKDFEGWITFKWERLWNPEIEPAMIALPSFIKYFNTINLNN